MDVILYVDGSFRSINSITPTEGYSGCGIHGYGYNEDTINKPNGDKPKNYFITIDGYLSSTAVKKENISTVIPCVYFDCIVSYSPGNTNSSIIELKAMIEALNYLLINNEELTLKNIKVFTDSSYVELMCNKILNNINWKDKTTSNVELVETLENCINKIKNNNLNLQILKIKGHDGELGNELVDKLAKIGSTRSKDNIVKCEWEKVPIAKGIKYWDIDIKPHPLIEFKQLFFSNLPSHVDNFNNKIYTILNYPTDVVVGKKTNEAMYGLIKLSQTPKEIESVIDIYLKYKESIYNNSIISTCNLNNLYYRDNLYFHNLAKEYAYRFAANNNHLYNILSKPVVYTIKPAVLAVQALEYMQELNTILNFYETNDYNKKIYTFRDITDKIYQIDKEKYKVILPQNENVCFMNIKDNDENSYLVPLELGKDTLTRNHFKHIEKKNPKVTLVLKKTSDNVVNYYTIVKVDDGIGVYCNLFSGRLYLNDKNFKKGKNNDV